MISYNMMLYHTFYYTMIHSFARTSRGSAAAAAAAGAAAADAITLL